MKKILVIDDSLMDRKLLSSMLKKLGIENEVMQAGDGEEGFKLLNDNFQNVALIFLDWQMPKLNGIEFMKTVVKIPQLNTVPIIMITASSTEDNKREAYSVNSHLAGYVVKPYKPENLAALIKPFLQ